MLERADRKTPTLRTLMTAGLLVVAYAVWALYRGRTLTLQRIGLVAAFAAVAVVLQLLWVWLGRGVWSWFRVALTFSILFLGSLAAAVFIKERVLAP